MLYLIETKDPAGFGYTLLTHYDWRQSVFITIVVFVFCQIYCVWYWSSVWEMGISFVLLLCGNFVANGSGYDERLMLCHHPIINWCDVGI